MVTVARIGINGSLSRAVRIHDIQAAIDIRDKGDLAAVWRPSFIRSEMNRNIEILFGRPVPIYD